MQRKGERESEMGSVAKKPHAIVIPYPAQGHVTPLLRLGKLLHRKGFFVTFVNTEFNHRRLLMSRGSHSLDGLPDFQFRSIPDGLPYSDTNATQDIPSLCKSTTTACLAPFCSLISELNQVASSSTSREVPPVSCIVSDGVMSFTIEAAQRFELPIALFWTTSACGLLGYMNYRTLLERGLVPLKDPSDLTNGYLETIVNDIEGMKNIRLRDFPSFVRTTDANDIMFNFLLQETERAPMASAIIMNTIDSLERESLDALSSILPPIYTVGPLHLLADKYSDERLKSVGSNLWTEQWECSEWLNSKEPGSVVYVNFGSVTVMTPLQLVEFAWGLANSERPFLWIIRPDLVVGDSAILPAEFIAETKERGMLGSWCRQDEVLQHPSVGGFLTHSGWNSTLESVCCGVPMLSWPFFAEQQTNCKYCCTEWGVGMEIDNNVKRDEVEKLVRELMEGEKGKEMKKMAMEWKRKAEESVSNGASSLQNLDKLIDQVLKSGRQSFS